MFTLHPEPQNNTHHNATHENNTQHNATHEQHKTEPQCRQGMAKCFKLLALLCQCIKVGL